MSDYETNVSASSFSPAVLVELGQEGYQLEPEYTEEEIRQIEELEIYRQTEIQIQQPSPI